MADWGSGEYPEWRWEDVEARGWEACVVLLLSLSLFSISLTCGFRLLTCLGSGCVCVYVCLCFCVCFRLLTCVCMCVCVCVPM